MIVYNTMVNRGKKCTDISDIVNTLVVLLYVLVLMYTYLNDVHRSRSRSGGCCALRSTILVQCTYLNIYK